MAGGTSFTTNYNTTHNHSGGANGQRAQSYSKNANMADGDAGGYKKPKGIIKAISEIQQYYVLEKQSEDSLPKEYFTVQQSLDFFNIGLKSALIEGIVFLSVVPFAEALYPAYRKFFYGADLTFNELFFIYAAAYSPVLVMTLFIAAGSKYYVGKLTKNAILSLISGRSMAFVIKGVVVFFLWMIISGLSRSNPEFVYNVADWTLFAFKSALPGYDVTADIVYEFYWTEAIPLMDKVSVHVLITMLFVSALPFITLVYKGWQLGRQERQAKQAYENY